MADFLHLNLGHQLNRFVAGTATTTTAASSSSSSPLLLHSLWDTPKMASANTEKKNLSPRMKVFTVGLDQKPPPPKEAEPLPSKTPLDEKTGTPPPGYSKTSSHNIPLPMGPEIPQPPPPIIVRKSRGYKGILMVMLAVFLMALFTLIISEIAYTRQRDENFFRLRWAELKHRLGYADNIYDYYHRTNNMHANRLYSLDRQRELLPDAFNSIKEPFTTTTSTTVAPPADEQSVLAEVIDTSRPRASFASSSASSEQQHQSSASEAMIRDARLQFLRTILQGIKQHAEDMGFDGTMQVSVIEVEPQDDSSDTASSSLRQRFGGSGAPLHQILPNLFSHFPSQRASGPLVDEPSPLSNVKSSSFLDGFGEFHQPSFAQNNRIAEQNRVRLVEAVNGNNAAWPRNTEFTNEEESQQPQQQAFNSEIPFQWTRVSAANADPFRQPPPLPPLAWNLLQEPLSQTPQFYQQQQQPQILPRPPVFFNGILVDGGNGNNNENEIQQPRRAEVPLQMFPLPPPISPVNGVSEMMAQQSQHQQPMMMANRFDARHNAQGMPNEEALGEMYGFKVGRMLQDIIANRLHGFQNLQQQQQQQQNPMGNGPAPLPHMLAEQNQMMTMPMMPPPPPQLSSSSGGGAMPPSMMPPPPPPPPRMENDQNSNHILPMPPMMPAMLPQPTGVNVNNGMMMPQQQQPFGKISMVMMPQQPPMVMPQQQQQLQRILPSINTIPTFLPLTNSQQQQPFSFENNSNNNNDADKQQPPPQNRPPSVVFFPSSLDGRTPPFGEKLTPIVSGLMKNVRQPSLEEHFPFPKASSMIAPEDRVQVEPPMFIPHIASQQLAQENDESNNNNNNEQQQQRPRMVVDNNIGWTHQQQPPLIDNEDDEQPQQQQPQISKPVVDNNNNNDNMESMRNFQKMMTAAAVIEQQQQQQPPQISKSIERPPQQQSPQPQAQQQQFGSAATSADSAGSSNEAGNSQSMADHWIHVAAPMFMGAQTQDKEETTAVKHVGPPQQQPQPQQPMFLPLEPSDNKNTNNGQQQSLQLALNDLSEFDVHHGVPVNALFSARRLGADESHRYMLQFPANAMTRRRNHKTVTLSNRLVISGLGDDVDDGDDASVNSTTINTLNILPKISPVKPSKLTKTPTAAIIPLSAANFVQAGDERVEPVDNDEWTSGKRQPNPMIVESKSELMLTTERPMNPSDAELMASLAVDNIGPRGVEQKLTMLDEERLLPTTITSKAFTVEETSDSALISTTSTDPLFPVTTPTLTIGDDDNDEGLSPFLGVPKNSESQQQLPTSNYNFDATTSSFSPIVTVKNISRVDDWMNEETAIPSSARLLTPRKMAAAPEAKPLPPTLVFEEEHSNNMVHSDPFSGQHVTLPTITVSNASAQRFPSVGIVVEGDAEPTASMLFDNSKVEHSNAENDVEAHKLMPILPRPAAGITFVHDGEVRVRDLQNLSNDAFDGENQVDVSEIHGVSNHTRMEPDDVELGKSISSSQTLLNSTNYTPIEVHPSVVEDDNESDEEDRELSIKPLKQYLQEYRPQIFENFEEVMMVHRPHAARAHSLTTTMTTSEQIGLPFESDLNSVDIGAPTQSTIDHQYGQQEANYAVTPPQPDKTSPILVNSDGAQFPHPHRVNDEAEAAVEDDDDSDNDNNKNGGIDRRNGIRIWNQQPDDKNSSMVDVDPTSMAALAAIQKLLNEGPTALLERQKPEEMGRKVDFPAVKFPLNAVATSNRESENSNNNEDEKNEENKPLLFSKQETEQAQQNDDESVQSQQQHSPAVGGRANPVFFQVDDPTSAEQPSVVPRRPLI